MSDEDERGTKHRLSGSQRKRSAHPSSVSGPSVSGVPRAPVPKPTQTPFNFIAESPARANWESAVMRVLARKLGRKLPFSDFTAAQDAYQNYLARLKSRKAQKKFARSTFNQAREQFYKYEHDFPSFDYSRAEKANLEKGKPPGKRFTIHHLEQLAQFAKRALDPANLIFTTGGKRGSVQKGSFHHLLHQRARQRTPGIVAKSAVTTPPPVASAAESESLQAVRTTAANQRGQGRMIPGTKGAVLSVVGGVLLAGLSQAALDKDVEERRDKTGLAAPSQDYDAGESRLLKVGRFLTGQKGQASLWERLNTATYRQHLRNLAAQARPGDELEVILPIRHGTIKSSPSVGDYYEYQEVHVVYRKYRYNPYFPQNGQWLDIRVDNWPSDAAILYVPDLDRIIDPNRSDSEIEDYLGLVRPTLKIA